ncbi:Spy0128 family protein [Enterococcus avium]|uniref:Spy0128 family protein n=9 Tax=Enterococcus TaxID=1350 RepID=UPI00288E7D1C|nr:FctA domain-containing protein [Enterococcus avium]MDT2379470.1 FctA domain-containing protein [Enterococcus avium]
MNRLKKIWSLSAIVGMLISSFPLSIFAETIESAEVVINQALITDTTDQEITETNRVKHKAAVKLKLDWSLAKATLIEENTIVTVNLPANLNFPDQSGSLADGMGNYQVRNQQLLFQLAKNYEETEDGRAPEFTSAKFYEGILELNAETTSEDLEIEPINFGDNIVSTIYYDKKVDPTADPVIKTEINETNSSAVKQTRTHNNNLNERNVKLFDSISITDRDGNPFTAENPAKYNDNIKIHIDWSLLDSVDIVSGDYYEYKLPESFAVHNPVSEILKNDGQELGTFHLDTSGNLKIVFNENAGNRSNRKGEINLSTSLDVKSIDKEIEIKTEIYDDQNKEITIVVPIFQMDISKAGRIDSNATVTWEIDFNKDGKSLTNVVVTDPMPEGLGYIASKGYIFKDGKWEETANLYTYNSVAQTFTFNDPITTPVKISINAYVDQKKTNLETYTNTAKITGNEFLEKDASATVSFKEVDNYKRFISYDPQTGEASWEVSASFTKADGLITDRTYEGKNAEGALHYLVEDSIEVKNKQDGSSINKDKWELKSTTKHSSGNTVGFEIKFKEAGSYLITYKTKMANPIMSDTRINNYMTVDDDGNKNDNSAGGTVSPETGIGVDKAADGNNKDVDKMILAWSAEINKAGITIDNLVVTDLYEMANGGNVSALTLIKDELVIKTVSGTLLVDGNDYEVEILTRAIPGTSEIMESGFKITFKKTITEKLMMTYKTKFDINKQNELKESGSFPSMAGNRFSNILFAEYKDENGISHKAGDQAEQWISNNWLKNADKGGFFVGEGEDVHEAMKKFLKKNNLNFTNIFEETEAPEDSVYWIAKFNLFKNKIPANYKIIDTLGEGQVLRKLTIYETTLNRDGDLTESYGKKLEVGIDYNYEVVNGDIVITLLKETDKTLSIAVAVDADEDFYRYKNYAELQNDKSEKIVSADAEVLVSEKDYWLTKEGLQNNRLVDWQVIINKDSKKIHNATIMDTVKLNQQTFILDEKNQVVVKVYEAIKNGNNFDKGSEVIFPEGKGASLLTDSVEGTQSLKIEFDEYIIKPYIIEYQTKLDPGIMNSEKITNDVKLSGGTTEIHQVTEEVIVKSTDGSGTSSGVNGALIIHKIDSDDKTSINESTFFNIYRKNSENNYEIFIPNLEVKNNKIVAGDGKLIDQLSNLRYGAYAIQEESAPDGYIKDDKLYEFTIDSKEQTYTFILENKKEVKEPAIIKLKAEKTLEGRALRDQDFSFTLKGDGGVDQTKKNDKDGKVLFDAITYDTAGTYEYTISEKIPAAKETGITYDDTKYKVTVTVEEKAGKLGATAVYENIKAGEVPMFKNTYKPLPGTIQLEAKKDLSGRPLKADEFSFTLKGDGGVDQTKKNAKDGKVLFDAIKYDQAGTYEYTISEVVPDALETGMTYDTKKYEVTVKVVEKDNKLEATATYKDVTVGEVPTFKNTYNALPGTIQLEAKKELSGRTLQADEFSFTLKGDGGVDQTKKNAKDGKVLFDAITYDQAGTYEYTISEKIPAAKETGVTYDDTKYKVTVTVEETTGKLEATAVYETGEVPTFKNAYKALPGSIQLEAKKELDGRSLKADEFSFNLKGDNVDQMKKNNADGKILFDQIDYDKAGTYEYTISEMIPADKETGLTYDEAVYKVTVTVVEEAGKLKAKVDYESLEAGEIPTFKNAYKALPGSIQLEAKKELDGRSLKADEFSFNLKGDNVDQMKKNNADGKILFDQIDYDKAGTYEYTISEMIPADKETGLTYDEAVYKVTVTVVEEAGKLKAKVDYESLEAGEIPTFKNVYKALPGSIQLEAKKELDGRSLKADEFSFNLKGDNVDQTKKNAADGKVTFDEITYDKAGTYEYTISEAIPTDKETGVTYDDTKYKVTVIVKEKAGMLEAAATYENLEAGELPIFRNLYTPEKEVPTGELLLKKIDSKTGRTLANAEFKLVDDKGQVVAGKEKIVTVEDGSIFIKGLADGEYQIIETKAPDGYLIDETPIKFSVKNNQPSKKEINQENDPLKLPETGNSSNKNTNVQTTYRNATGKRTTVSKRLPSTGSIQSKGLVILGLFFLAMFGLVVFGKRKNI